MHGFLISVCLLWIGSRFYWYFWLVLVWQAIKCCEMGWRLYEQLRSKMRLLCIFLGGPAADAEVMQRPELLQP